MQEVCCQKGFSYTFYILIAWIMRSWVYMYEQKDTDKAQKLHTEIIGNVSWLEQVIIFREVWLNFKKHVLSL